MIVKRKKLNLWERLYLPAIIGGFKVTHSSFFQQESDACNIPRRNGLCRRVIAERLIWSKIRKAGPNAFPANFANSSARPKHSDHPARADWGSPEAGNVEKAPKEFEINMLRCIFCGYCQEVCPEEAIFLMQDYSLTGDTREELIYNKEKLLALGRNSSGPDPKMAARKPMKPRRRVFSLERPSIFHPVAVRLQMNSGVTRVKLLTRHPILYIRVRDAGVRFPGGSQSFQPKPGDQRHVPGSDHCFPGRACSCCCTRFSSPPCKCWSMPGAVMVLFLFVIMLLDLRAEEAPEIQSLRVDCRRASPRVRSCLQFSAQLCAIASGSRVTARCSKAAPPIWANCSSRDTCCPLKSFPCCFWWR